MLKLVFLRLEMGVSGNLWSCPTDVRPLVLYDGERVIALKPLQGNQSSFRVNLGYTKIFHIPALTSVSF